ncbi:hypothetical protein ES703_121399 [subsurface metagenome]
MIEVDEIKNTKALRAFAKQDELDQAAAELLKKAREMEALPSTMEFRQMAEYEETSEYQIVLWCS